MSDIKDYPCPHCGELLLLEAETSGIEVECPYCGNSLMMPVLTTEGEERNPDIKPVAHWGHRPAAAHNHSVPEEAERHEVHGRNIPLWKRDEPAEEPQVTPLALPEPISKTEEVRRLAAIAASAEFDFENLKHGGKAAFACPCCHRPIWVTKKEHGKIVICGGCSEEIVAPDPELRTPARLVNPEPSGPTLPKAVLPTSRRVHDQGIGEAMPKGRQKRSANVAPSQGSIQPVPVKADKEFGGSTPTQLPKERKSQALTRGAQKKPAPDTEEQAVEVEVEGEETPSEENRGEAEPAPKGFRLAEERKLHFSAKTEGELQVEQADWGAVEKSRPISKRMLLIGTILLVPSLIGVAFYFLHSSFSKTDTPADTLPTDALSRDKALAEDVARKFLTATSIEEMAQYVRHPEITKPRMEKYYQRAIRPTQLESLQNFDSINLGDFRILMAGLILKGEKPKSMAFFTAPASAGIPSAELLVDWESYVFWSEVPWIDFMKTKMEEACRFRIILRQEANPYYNVPFDDEFRWASFKLIEPASFYEHSESSYYCHGYCEADSAVMAHISQALQVRRRSGAGAKEGVELRGIVTIRFTPESHASRLEPQVIIERYEDTWFDLEK